MTPFVLKVVAVLTAIAFSTLEVGGAHAPAAEIHRATKAEQVRPAIVAADFEGSHHPILAVGLIVYGGTPEIDGCAAQAIVCLGAH